MNDTVLPQPLNAEQHQALKIRPGAQLAFAASQHVILVRASEIGHAAACFPVFLNRHGPTGGWLFSALSSFDVGQNLYVNEDRWEATYRPSILETYPLVLAPGPTEGAEPVVAIVPGRDGLSETEGVALFDANGKPSIEVSQIEKILRSDLENDVQSRAFAETLVALELHKSIDIVVSRRSGPSQTIRGLFTIDEARLQSLDDAAIVDLHKRGYLMAIHAMLCSLGQLNVLVRRSASRGGDSVTQVRLGSARDPGAAEGQG